MRLIDADILPRHGNRGGLVHWQDIEDAPTVDAVEVVRCKDCEFYVTDGGALMICDITNCIVIDDDYCGYGRTKRNS